MTLKSLLYGPSKKAKSIAEVLAFRIVLRLYYK